MKCSGINKGKGERAYIAYLLCFLVYFCVLFFLNKSVRHVVVFVGSIINYYIVFTTTSRKRTLPAIISNYYLISVMVCGIIINYSGPFWEVVYCSLNFASAFIILTADSFFLITDRLRRFTVYICVMISFVALLLIRSSVAYVMENGRTSPYLTLGFTNPNLTGLILFGVFCVLLINSTQEHRAIQYISLVLLLYLIYLTGSRSSVVSALVILVYFVFFSNRQLPKAIVMAVLLIPLAFPFVYVWLNYRFGDVYFLEKPLFTGREILYIWHYEKLKDNSIMLLFGDMNTKFSNAHNAPLAVLLTIGLIGMTIVYVRIIKQLLVINECANSRISRTAVVALLSIFILSSTEAYFIMGTFPGVALLYIIVSLSKDGEETVGDLQ